MTVFQCFFVHVVTGDHGSKNVPKRKSLILITLEIHIAAATFSAERSEHFTFDFKHRHIAPKGKVFAGICFAEQVGSGAVIIPS